MKVYLIGGKGRSGKDTFADTLEDHFLKLGKKVCRTQVSKYIKVYARDYFGWDGKEETKPRKLLQELGTDIIRIKLNKPLFFIKRTLEDLEILENFFDICIISDLRFPEEFDIISEKYPNSLKIFIERPEFETPLNKDEQKHLTEIGLDSYSDYDMKIINDKTIADLEAKAIELAEGEI